MDCRRVRREVEAAAAGWLAIISTALAFDLWLIKRGHPSLSECAGKTTARRLAVAYLAAHLLVRHQHARRVDPLSLIAGAIRAHTTTTR